MAGHPTPCMHNGHTETAMAPIERGQIWCKGQWWFTACTWHVKVTLRSPWLS
jgi:hypothetical protein